MGKLRRQLLSAYRYVDANAGELSSFPVPKQPRPQYQLEKLEQLARKLTQPVTPEYLEARSQFTCWNRSPAGFLHKLYKTGEKVIVFDVLESQGCEIWEHPGSCADLSALDYLTKDHFGV
jgi:hypothetical protein